VDRFTGRNIRKKLCGKKPAATGKTSRKCNNFGCDFRSDLKLSLLRQLYCLLVSYIEI
jgi:hypothetical protein